LNFKHFTTLILLAAIWGASFFFIRIAVPTLGPAVLMAGRVICAAIFLLIVAVLLRKPLFISGNSKHFMLLGFINSALPFFLFAFSAHWLSASVMSVLNATAPIWATLIGAIFFRHKISWAGAVGLILGVLGVAILVGFDPLLLKDGAYWAVAAAASAACCYGIATHYTRRAKAVEPFANAHGSMWAAAIWLLPLTWFFPVTAEPNSSVGLALLALGVVCTGIAYLLYFGLVRDIGATPTLTVTFLIPVFGVLWGHLFLDEPVGLHTLVGTLFVLSGTGLVTGFRPLQLWKQSSTKISN
jgi:drug/metabolite transporter (DMT)-like permease